MKKRKKEKHKKKSKKSKKGKHYSDSSQSEDEWEESGSSVTKSTSQGGAHDSSVPVTEECKDEKVEREEWMSSSLLDVAYNTTNVRENKTKQKKLNDRRKEEERNQEIYQARELNPYWKSEPTGLEDRSPPPVLDSKKKYSVGDGGQSWIHKAYERAKERAKEENVPIECIVSERWGSMEKLEALLKAAHRTPRSTHFNSKESSSWRKSQIHCIQTSGSSTHGESNMRNTTLSNINVSDEKLEPNVKKVLPGQVDEITKESYPVSNKIVIKSISEKEKNELNAKLIRAELMGDDDLVAELKRKLDYGGLPADEGKPRKLAQRKRKDDDSSSSEEEIILTRKDKHGNLYPIKLSTDDSQKSKRKKKVMSTHDESGERMRYFEDDDETDLKTMVEQEHLTSADDQQAMLARLAGKHLGRAMGDDYTIDDMFVQASATKGETKIENKRIKEIAIAEDKRHKKQLLNCRFCFENPNVAKHLIISVGTNVYLSLPINASLTECHCLIIPMNHVSAQTYLDEDVMEEIKKFKKCLTRMFADMNDDIMFLETCKNLHGHHHCVIECIPVPKEIGDMAPIYFKKAITETGSEWSENKKLITITSKCGLSKAVPKGLPYFAVEFGFDGGFGHIIEEESFPHYFGKEVIGGMMDLEPRLWLKPPKESFQQHKKKVLHFTESWKEYDWTLQ